MVKYIAAISGLVCLMGLVGCTASDLSVLGPIPGLDQWVMQSQRQAAMNAALPAPISAAYASQLERQSDTGATFQILWQRFSPYPFERQQRANLRSMGEPLSAQGGMYSYLKFAADRGDPEGEFFLAILYRCLSEPGANGVFGQIPEVPIGASPQQLYATFYAILREHEFKWLTKASLAGIPRAEMMLAGMYQTGTACSVDHAKAVYWCGQAARQGFMPAELAMGIIDMHGLDGVAVDRKDGFRLIHSVAQSGIPYAEYEVAEAYEHGWGTAASRVKMQNWLTLAYNAHWPAAEAMQARIWLAPLRAQARSGNVAAEYSLGYDELNGMFNKQPIPPNPAEAVIMFRRLAMVGDALGEFCLGYCYQTGKGTVKHYRLALHYYRLAIQQHSAAAEDNLGLMYQDGQGVGPSISKALYWYSRAARGGDAMAKANIRHMLRRRLQRHPSEPFTQQQQALITAGIGAQMVAEEEQQQQEQYAQQSAEEEAQIAADNAAPPDPDEITPDDEIVPDDEGPGP